MKKKIKTWLIHLVGGVTVAENKKRNNISFLLGMKGASIFVTMRILSTASLPVLVRDNNEQEWKINFFSHYDKNVCYKYYCLKSCYNQCIFYEGNEHLLGTTDPYTEGGDK